MNDYKIATEPRENGKIMYRPIVNGYDTSHLFENYDQALIFAIAYANLKNMNDTIYAEEFISRMLKINQ